MAVKFDFDVLYPRKGTGSAKWDYPPYPNVTGDYIPMFVADMDFAAAPCIIDAVKKFCEETPVMGYYRPTQAYYDAVMGWQQRHFGVTDLKPEYIAYHNGVVGGVTSVITAFTKPGDPILLQSPGYPSFVKTIENVGRRVLANPMIRVGDHFSIDFARMEEQIKENDVKLAILCNPHNPTGRVWTREELTTFAEVCHRNKVLVIADEIWADLVISKEVKFTPFFSTGEKAREIGMAFYSCSKTFNIAGLVSSYSVIYNPDLAKAVAKEASLSHYNNGSALSMAATIGALTGGDEWSAQCIEYISGNMDYIVDFLAKNCPNIHAYKPEGTYVMWLDFSKTGLTHEEIVDRCTYKAGVIFNNGTTFVANGEKHMRLNAATPRAYVVQAMDRLAKVFGDVAR